MGEFFSVNQVSPCPLDLKASDGCAEKHIFIKAMDDDVAMNEKASRCFWRMAVAIAVQSAVTAVCLAAVCYLYYHVQQPEPKRKDIYIQFHPISGVPDANEPVRFNDYTSNMMTLDPDRSHINVACNGPHVFHMDMCVEMLDQEDSWGSGNLTLRVKDQNLVSFPLHSKREACVQQQQMVFLHKGQAATVHFTSSKLMVQKLTLGLHYMLGMCQF